MSWQPLNLAHHPRKVFAKHFLASVHCEFGLAGITVDRVLAAEETLKAKLMDLGFSGCQKVYTGNFQMENPKDGGPVKLTHQANVTGLVFASTNPRREVQIWGDRIFFTDFSYKGFEDFRDTVSKISERAISTIGECSINKVGLRKICSILISPVLSYPDACSIFNPALFGVERSGLIADEALQGSEQVVSLERAGGVCVLRARMKKMPEANTCEASLDFDLVSKGTTDLSTAVTTLLPELNATHFDLFMWSVTDKLISLMENK